MRNYDLIIFDVDGTLIENPDTGMVFWQCVYEPLGILEERLARYQSYLKGELTYQQVMDSTVETLQHHNVRKSDLLHTINFLKPIFGVSETIAKLKDEGYKLAVISETLDLVVEKHFPDNPFAITHANSFYFDHRGNIVGAQPTLYAGVTKRDGVIKVAHDLGVPLARTVYVGDSTNDLEALRVAGLGVAFAPKDGALLQVADKIICQKDMRRLLLLLKEKKAS